MKIIDAHIHFSKIEAFADCARDNSLVDYSYQGYIREAQANGVVGSVCMGLSETTPTAFPDPAAQNPMRADLADTMPPGMKLCLGINPHTLTPEGVRALDEEAGSGRVAGFKIYAGYYHTDANDPVYAPVYALAQEHDLTVAVHCGDTYSARGLLEYSHPLRMDRLAVTHPELRLVICHMGVPWVFDAAEVAAKNPNVHIDLSGLLVGGTEYIAAMSAKEAITGRYAQALAYLACWEKVLFGTDWPLAPMSAYIEFCKTLIPADKWETVFYGNAARVYRF